MESTKGKNPVVLCNDIASSVEEFEQEKCLKKVEESFKNVKLELDLAKACEDADLVIESMPEITNEKIAFY